MVLHTEELTKGGRDRDMKEPVSQVEFNAMRRARQTEDVDGTLMRQSGTRRCRVRSDKL